MITFLTVLYVFVCFFLILVVLLQSGKGGGMGSAFGGSGGAGQQVFGGAGAGNILTKITAVSAALFMILSATLAYHSSKGQQALLRASERQQAEAVEAAEAAARARTSRETRAEDRAYRETFGGEAPNGMARAAPTASATSTAPSAGKPAAEDEASPSLLEKTSNTWLRPDEDFTPPIEAQGSEPKTYK